MKGKKKGITLIALVITIIVMIILTAVVVVMAFGDDGVISEAKSSTVEAAKMELIESLQRAHTGARIKAAREKTSYNLEYFRSEVLGNHSNEIILEGTGAGTKAHLKSNPDTKILIKDIFDDRPIEEISTTGEGWSEESTILKLEFNKKNSQRRDEDAAMSYMNNFTSWLMFDTPYAGQASMNALQSIKIKGIKEEEILTVEMSDPTSDNYWMTEQSNRRWQTPGKKAVIYQKWAAKYIGFIGGTHAEVEFVNYGALDVRRKPSTELEVVQWGKFQGEQNRPRSIDSPIIEASKISEPIPLTEIDSLNDRYRSTKGIKVSLSSVNIFEGNIDDCIDEEVDIPANFFEKARNAEEIWLYMPKVKNYNFLDAIPKSNLTYMQVFQLKGKPKDVSNIFSGMNNLDGLYFRNWTINNPGIIQNLPNIRGYRVVKGKSDYTWRKPGT